MSTDYTSDTMFCTEKSEAAVGFGTGPDGMRYLTLRGVTMDGKPGGMALPMAPETVDFLRKHTAAISPAEQERLSAGVRRKAHELRENAGYAGEWGDGGARALEARLEAWEAGLEGRNIWEGVSLPPETPPQADPEWAEYQRLRQKFAGDTP